MKLRLIPYNVQQQITDSSIKDSHKRFAQSEFKLRI
jgi:hypothetical protein